MKILYYLFLAITYISSLTITGLFGFIEFVQIKDEPSKWFSPMLQYYIIAELLATPLFWIAAASAIVSYFATVGVETSIESNKNE